MKNSTVYLIICSSLLVFQGLGFFNQKTFYTDNPFLIVFSTLVVLILPGMLVYPVLESMMKSHKDYGLPSAFTLMAAFSFIVQFFLCIIVFVLNLNIYHASLIFFAFNFILFAVALYKTVRRESLYMKISIKNDHVNNAVFLFFLILFSYLLYRLGTNSYDIGGELLLQLATVRKIFENPFLKVNNVSYALGETTTYIFPIWQFTIALISKIAHVDPVIVFFRLRWFGALYSLVAIYALTNIIFKGYKYNVLIMNIIATLAFTGIYITDYKATTISDMINRGMFNLLPTPHTADVAMVVLMPMGIFLALLYLRHPSKILAIFLTSFFTMLTIFHVREYFQMLFYFIPFGFVLFFIEKEKMKNYFVLFVSMFIAGLLMYALQMLYAEHIVHLSAEMGRKRNFINEISEIFRNNPMLLIKKTDFYGFGELNMHLSLLTFYLLPFFLLSVNKNANSMFLIFVTLISFVTTQTMIFKKLVLFLTYSEFFICTARLVFIFTFIMLGYLIVKAVIKVNATTGEFLKKRVNNTVITSFFLNLIGALFTVLIFIFLNWYVRDGRLENLLNKYLYFLTWIYFVAFIIFIIKKRTTDNNYGLKPNENLPTVVSLSLLLIVFFTTPNVITSAQHNKSQNKDLWTTNVITDIPIDLISFIREKLPDGSVFAVNTASKTSIFLYANIYVDHFPPLICNNIRREDEAYTRRFDENRPIYGMYTSMAKNKEYIKLNRIKYILLEPDNSAYLKNRYEKESKYFRKIYDKDDYIIFEVIA
jgi:hypothetical protein